MDRNTLELRRKARELWAGNRHNQHAWLRSVLRLGDKWLLAKQVQRQTYTKER